jgi:transcriptional/translational regulatory protein YebC/TACO1
LENTGVTFISAQVEMVPQTTVALTSDDDIKNMRRLLDMLEDNDDVQNVWHNWEE